MDNKNASTTFINSDRRKGGDSSDPDKESWTQSGAEITSDSEERDEQSPSHVRSNFTFNPRLNCFLIVAVFETIYECIIDGEYRDYENVEPISGSVFSED